MDSALGLYKAHFHALALEHSNLKSLVEAFISQEKARGKKKVEVTTVIDILQYLLIHLPESLECFALSGTRRYYLYATARFWHTIRQQASPSKLNFILQELIVLKLP